MGESVCLFTMESLLTCLMVSENIDFLLMLVKSCNVLECSCFFLVYYYSNTVLRKAEG